MATSETIRVQAQTISGIQIDPATAFLWVKEEMNNIVYQNKYAGRRVTEIAEIKEAGEEFEASNEIVAIDKIYTDENRKFFDYELHNSTITFNSNGVFKVRYYTTPTEPETYTSELDIPTPYIMALKYYLAARIRARLYGQADDNATSFYQEYATSKTEARNYLSNRDRGHRRIPVGRK